MSCKRANIPSLSFMVRSFLQKDRPLPSGRREQGAEEIKVKR